MEGYPVRHKAKVPFAPILKLNMEYRKMVEMMQDIDRRLGDFILTRNDYLELVEDAYANNIHWSVKLEGNDLPLGEVKKLTKLFTDSKIGEINAGPQQEVLNHLYSFFATDILKLPWDIDHATLMHGILMKDVGIAGIPGEIRDVDVSVYGSDGTEYFRSCPHIHIEKELESLFEWLSGSPYDAITTAVLFFHEFESIHPFRDGNGRVGRTLFQILLQELGLKNAKLCKFEQELLEDSETYYSLLAYTDKTVDYTPLVMYVTESLLQAYREALKTFEEKDVLKELDENSKAIVRHSKTVSEFSVADVCARIPALGEQSIRVKLNELVEMGVLAKSGKTRSTRFSFNDPFRGIKKTLKSFETLGRKGEMRLS